MSKFVPFTLHVRVVPARGKRFEYIRDLQKIATLVYDGLIGLSGFKFATPGGGQSMQTADIQRRGGLGSYSQGTAVKPQFGQTPAQLMITGFYVSSAENAQPYANTQRISGGTVYSGPAAHPYDAVPSATITTEVKALKSSITAAITDALPVGVEFSIFRIDYSGIVFGNGGFHFPQ